jgi:hypothetical protein
MALTNYISTVGGVTLIYDNHDPVMVSATDTSYTSVMDSLNGNRWDDACLMWDKLESLRVITEKTQSKFKIEHGYVYIDGERLPDILSERLIEFADSELDTKPLENFWKNLRMNPSKDAQEDLYTFLENGKFPITSDGCFVAYKRVNQDFKDIHTRTMDNSPGTIVQLAREKVNPDRHQTCSSGLHVANHHYAAHIFGTSVNTTDKMVLVKVNPRNVVAVPTDYNNQKMRVCEYEVLKEIEFDFTCESHVWEDARTPAFSGWSEYDYDDESNSEDDEYEYGDDDEDGELEDDKDYYTSY